MSEQAKRTIKVKDLAELSILFSLLLLFSVLESFLPPPPLPLPLRWGFSNLVVMYAIFSRPPHYSLILVVLRALFAFLIRGVIAFGLSLCGGLLAWLLTIILYHLRPGFFSISFLSILSALAHQIGQLFALSFFYQGFGLENLSRLLLPLAIIAYLTGALNAFLLANLKQLEKLKLNSPL